MPKSSKSYTVKIGGNILNKVNYLEWMIDELEDLSCFVFNFGKGLEKNIGIIMDKWIISLGDFFQI